MLLCLLGLLAIKNTLVECNIFEPVAFLYFVSAVGVHLQTLDDELGLSLDSLAFI